MELVIIVSLIERSEWQNFATDAHWQFNASQMMIYSEFCLLTRSLRCCLTDLPDGDKKMAGRITSSGHPRRYSTASLR
jgi:hypothetical protein